MHKRDPEAATVRFAEVAQVTEGFTGSEIAALVPDAMFAAFGDGGREINTDDLLAAAKTVAPLSRMADGKIDKLRAWAVGRARPASATKEAVASPSARVLDIAS
jgi:SpoVK/Ycf46/Vps4 family AAA+-type ATPase